MKDALILAIARGRRKEGARDLTTTQGVHDSRNDVNQSGTPSGNFNQPHIIKVRAVTNRQRVKSMAEGNSVNLRSKVLLQSGDKFENWCGDKSDRKSTVGYVFFFNGAPISWSSIKEPVVALSSCEAEYIAACEATCQAAWLSSLMSELKIEVEGKVRLLVDNKSAIDLTKHPTSHGRSKHIETRFHYIREQVSKGKLEVVYCRSEDHIADILTKALKGERFLTLRKQIEVRKVEIKVDLQKRTMKT
ncbi:hypothetical protein VIGAN_03101800 [Vigna angularis var. angularis]|uniref:Reverse transcriptase Ty1/copia-type domain-containing protein n=1 Tax=Vigna angularis var. angularis TaxID=157739 RepID=A0A0S3RLA2_PHAAN|nr:hypothetical protein VIGAN_03101800 [Vigna angularis var. angularis]